MKGATIMDKWEKDMIAAVNRNADCKALERRLKAISAKRKKGAKK